MMFLELEKVLPMGVELFLFCGGGVWLCDPVGVGGEGGVLAVRR